MRHHVPQKRCNGVGSHVVSFNVILLLKLWNLGTWRVGWTAKYDDIVRCSASCPAGPWPTSASDQRNAKLEMGFSCELTSDASREISCFDLCQGISQKKFRGVS